MSHRHRQESHAYPYAADPRRSHNRFFIAVAAGVLTALLLVGHTLPLRLLAGWDAGSAVLLLLTWPLILRAGPEETRRRSALQDPGRTAVWVTVIITGSVGLLVATVLMRKASEMAPDATRLWTGLSLAAIILSWILTHTSWTLRYAHLYYGHHGEHGGGLTFPPSPDMRRPADLDFAYFAFTLGMCFQVSDVVISSHLIRRAALVHGLQSFVYNTAVLATAINVWVGS